MPEDIKQFSIHGEENARVASFVAVNDEVSTYPITEAQESNAQAFLSDLMTELKDAPEKEEEDNEQEQQ